MLPQAPRRGNDNPRCEHFTYVSTPHGYSWNGWIAGPVHWLWVHPKKAGTTPCMRMLTGEEYTCSKCSALNVPLVKGYLPLYRQTDAKPVFVICDEAIRDTLDAFRLHTRVLVGRERTLGSGVYVALCLDDKPRFQSTLPQRQKPVDLTPTLLRVFKSAELIDWYKCTHGLGEVVPQVATSPEMKQEVQTIEEDDSRLIGNDVLGKWIAKLPKEQQDKIRERRRNAEPSKNGAHKPK